MDKKEFKEFFKPYSKNVDKADNQYFWKLSDNIILNILKKHLKKDDSKTLLDAGGGTGRWIIKLKKEYDFNFILCDLSEDMLNQAKKNFEKEKINDVKIIQNNLENIKDIKDNSVDYITSLYNPISFVENIDQVFKELSRILKKQGTLMIMGQGYYNALFSKINNYLADGNELKKLEKSHKVNWGGNTPPLNVFTKESFKKHGQKANLEYIKSYGVPVFAQPNDEDFDSQNKKKGPLSTKLENDKEFFNQVFNIEIKYNDKPSVVNRGMNILSVFKK